MNMKHYFIRNSSKVLIMNIVDDTQGHLGFAERETRPGTLNEWTCGGGVSVGQPACYCPNDNPHCQSQNKCRVGSSKQTYVPVSARERQPFLSYWYFINEMVCWHRCWRQLWEDEQGLRSVTQFLTFKCLPQRTLLNNFLLRSHQQSLSLSVGKKSEPKRVCKPKQPERVSTKPWSAL